MKTIIFVLSFVLLFACQSYAQSQTGDSDTTVTKPSSTVVKPGTLSDKDIEELKTELTDEKTKQKLLFVADFSLRKPTQPAEKKKYEKSGKIPFRITATLYDVKDTGGKPLYRRFGGTAKFYLINSDGKVVLTESASLDKMCPS